MPQARLHRFERDGHRYVIDPESCFCFECDDISWDVLDHYPDATANRIEYLLKDSHPVGEVREVISELEWLRSTKSILRPRKVEDLPKQFEVTPGLRQVYVEVGEGGAEDWQRARDACTLLLGRAIADGGLTLTIALRPASLKAPQLAAFLKESFRQAALAGRDLTVALELPELDFPKAPDALEACSLGVRLHLSAVNVDAPSALAAALNKLPALAKLASGNDAAARLEVVCCPRTPRFENALEALEKLGFKWITLDMDKAFATCTDLDLDATFESLRRNAEYYANRLLRHHYFRADPFAKMFWSIYNGTPEPRHDPAAVNAVAIDQDGSLYPSPLLLGKPAYRLGSLDQATIDPPTRRRFERLGAIGVTACKQCWARNLCGGGNAAVHHARTGDAILPDPAWCDGQRHWCEAAVSAFNLLSTHGVNFTRVYQQLDTRAKPSLFKLARTAFRMNIGLRPIEDSDAELLAKWENWNEAAYFLFNEDGLLIANTYDREMDALHPHGIDQEFLLLQKDGSPMGLLKVRPDKWPGTALAWVFLRQPEDYAARAVQKSFKTILEEAAGQQALQRVMVPVGPFDDGLAAFLEACGFVREGTQREALFLHGAYHDVSFFGKTLTR
jgi:radical SAM protein with 4Fe4S-binding SPASM domain